jgi:hypothetical protein
MIGEGLWLGETFLSTNMGVACLSLTSPTCDTNGELSRLTPTVARTRGV